MKRLIPLTFLTIIAATTLHAQTVYQDLPYSTNSNVNKLDLYVPENVENPPVIISFHGGAFKMGDKAEGPIQSENEALVDAGFAVASVNYRLSDEAQYPAQIDDLSNAIKFLRAHDEEYGIDASRMGSFGASAGGYLATMAGIVLANDPELHINAVVDGFGPILFNEMDADMQAIGKTPKHLTNDPRSPESEFLGEDLAQNPDAAIQASPLNFIEKSAANIPPFLIVHGEDDDLISWKQSERLHNALSQNGTPSEFIIVKGAGHGKGVFNTEVMPHVIAFFKQHLGV